MLVVMVFAVVSTLVGGVQGNSVVQRDEGDVCLPYLPCRRPNPCCPPPSKKATNP